ncbi:MAG: orotidine-5'-phosphate decarboxylase [Betaproteobacteria bacterium]|nr:orotidine-5'-phosphate decarboxylase [Betaproteobacteria bacterium]
MTFLEQLQGAERQNGSLLCVGLDPEPSKFPAGMKGDASKIYDFCAQMVDATADLVISFKPQIAYFAAYRAEDQLEKLMDHMRRNAPHVPVILDAKRGDIGSTAEQYAKEAFERYGADAVTLSPFMQGGDAVATIQAGYRQSHGATTGAVIVNSSRAILYASSGDDFAQAARNEAMRTRDVLKAAAQS